MNRYFNTSGPCNPKQHYTLMRPDLIAEGIDLVERERYFTIWAPRQTGKSTFFRLLANKLDSRGFKVIHFNVENFKEALLITFFTKLTKEFQKKGIVLPHLSSFGDLSNFIETLKDDKLVLIIDEIEGLNPELFNQFLHSIRNLYHFRNEHSLKSVILVGVSNIVGVVEDNASPFNIADNLNVPYFTNEETRELLGQHETETGQLFDDKVKAKISEITANQPGLVNGFAKKLVDDNPDKKVIDYNDYLKVENWYLKIAIDKNVANIVNKARPYRSFVEKLLFTETKVPFDIGREAIKILHINGLITYDEDSNVKFWVPLYRKRLYSEFYPYMNGETTSIQRNMWIEEFFFSDKTLNIPKLIKGYKEYVERRGFKYFREKDENGKYLSIKEAALLYSFETYIQAFLQLAKGKSYLEAHTGLGRSDLIINLQEEEYCIEAKVYHNATWFRDGKPQLAYYCKKMGLQLGHYLVFIPNTVNLPADIKEGSELVNDIMLHIHLIFYDEEKDF